MIIKGMNRENKRRKQRKMKVNGAGVRNLQRIIVDKSNKVKRGKG